MALFFIGTSCSNKPKSTEETASTEQTSGAMEIDDLLANAESLTDQEVTIEGVCTHACKHGATKIFLMGSDDTQTIRVEAAKLGSFDTKCVNLIQYAVAEAAAAGITEMIFVTGRNKRAIEDHFDSYPELERELEEKGKDELLELVRGIVPAGVKCIYIRQPKALGLGHAVLCAKPVVGDEPFGVMLADDLVDAPSSCIGQLTAVREARGGGSVIAVQDVAPEATNKYGIVSVDDTSLQTSQMRGIVEKPDPKVAPSRMAVIGRYVFEPEVFDYLEKVTVGVGGEIQLTDGIASSLDTVPTYAHRFEGTRFDCGSKQGFLDATIHFARKRGFKIN